MEQDIGDILDGWPYDPNTNVRQIVDADGNEKTQVRIEQGPFRGVLQMNLEGRPDAVHPHGRDFALDHFQDELAEHLALGRDETAFRLDSEACNELFDEGSRIYERYAFLLRLADFERVLRDTDHNMRLFRFVNKYAAKTDDAMRLERWWPYILRIHATAKVMLAVKGGDYSKGLELVREVRRQISALPEVDAMEFHNELRRSLEALDELEEELASHRPLSRYERLSKQLDEAVAKEEFERAAELRDHLRRLDEEVPKSEG